MPLFEYRCATCGHLEEVLQKHGDPAPDPCPSCGASATMSKEVSLTSFQLKGGGWYKDLYSSTPKEGAKAESATKGESKHESKGDSSSDTSAKKDAPKKAEGGSSPSSSSSSSSSSASSAGGSSSSAPTKAKASSAAAA